MTQGPNTRPGGRSARIRAAVTEAVAALLPEKGAALTMADIAERAGIAATSLYRRWGDLPALLVDIAVERLRTDFPVPDTGSLSGDLKGWAGAAARSLKSGAGFHRILIATAPGPSSNPAQRLDALSRRAGEIEAALERARARGETAPAVMDVVDHVLAPLYWRMIIGMPADEAFAHGLVDRLLVTTKILQSRT